MRLLQTVALSLLLAVLLVVLAMGVAFGLSDALTWTLTPLAFTICAACLFAVAAVTVARELRNLLVALICFVSVLALPAVVMLDAPVNFPLAALVVLGSGVIALLVASIVGNRERERRFSTLVVVVASLATLAIVGGAGFMGAGRLYGINAVHVGPRSPDGA